MRIDYNKALELLNNAKAELGDDHKDNQDGGDCSYYATERVVSSYSDDEYEDVYYQTVFGDDGRALPSCIVGNALYQCGVDPYKVKEGPLVEIVTVDHQLMDNAAMLALDGAGEEVTFTVEAVRLLSAAQSAQDAGAEWGDAVTNARRLAEHEFRTRIG